MPDHDQLVDDEFGDVDPEDAWDDDDDDETKVVILERVVIVLLANPDRDERREFRRVDGLRLVAKLAATRGSDPRLLAVQDALETM